MGEDEDGQSCAAVGVRAFHVVHVMLSLIIDNRLISEYGIGG